jgi:hypothetical protein
MSDPETIREAFAALADQAPPPDRIRASLAVRARRHRQRRLALRLAGGGVAAVATAGLAAGAWRLTRPPEPGFPVLAGGPGGGWLEVPLRVRPTWLPHRYGEAQRTIVVDGDQVAALSRDWHTSGGQEVISLLVGWHPSFERPSGQPTAVDVDGTPGQLVQSEGSQPSTYLTWRPPGQPQLVLAVMTADDAKGREDLAVRVARSVRTDPGRTWVGPRLGWLPPHLAGSPWRLGHGYRDTDWYQDVTVTSTDGRQLIISMGTSPAHRLDNTFATEPVQIRGWNGVQAPQMGQIFLTLPDGIEVFAQLDGASDTEQEMPSLVRVMEHLDLGPWPDMTWVGGR